MSENLGYCSVDDTPLVWDAEVDKLLENLPPQYALFRLVKCPKCGSSYFADNPYIKMTSKEYAEQVIRESDANWKKNHPSLLSRIFRRK